MEHQPLVFNCGVGRDSVAGLVGCRQRDIVPDLIIFADVGAEKPQTYAYIPVLRDWLRKVGFPDLTIVRYEVRKFKHWPPYYSLEENCLTNSTVPGITIGNKSCSGKWKSAAIHRYLREQWWPSREAWALGGKVRKAIGFEDSPHELGRTAKCTTFAVEHDETKFYDLWFPLQEWHWDLTRCIAEIQRAGLPVPVKSACYFCMAQKPHELAALGVDQLKRIVVIEARANPRFVARAKAEGWPKPRIEGLWRTTVKGCRGATPHPGSMTQYIRERGLLPAAEIDRLIAATPTELFSKADFDRLGFGSWQDWLQAILNPAPGHTYHATAVPDVTPVTRPAGQLSLAL